jgi:hypothetical protein
MREAFGLVTNHSTVIMVPVNWAGVMVAVIMVESLGYGYGGGQMGWSYGGGQMG